MDDLDTSLLSSFVEAGKKLEGANALPPQTEASDERLISLDITPFEIVEQSPSLAHQFQQTAAGVVVLLVDLEVLRELFEPLGQ